MRFGTDEGSRVRPASAGLSLAVLAALLAPLWPADTAADLPVGYQERIPTATVPTQAYPASRLNYWTFDECGDVKTDRFGVSHFVGQGFDYVSYGNDRYSNRFSGSFTFNSVSGNEIFDTEVGVSPSGNYVVVGWTERKDAGSGWLYFRRRGPAGWEAPILSGQVFLESSPPDGPPLSSVGISDSGEIHAIIRDFADGQWKHVATASPSQILGGPGEVYLAGDNSVYLVWGGGGLHAHRAGDAPSLIDPQSDVATMVCPDGGWEAHAGGATDGLNRLHLVYRSGGVLKYHVFGTAIVETLPEYLDFPALYLDPAGRPVVYDVLGNEPFMFRVENPGLATPWVSSSVVARRPNDLVERNVGSARDPNGIIRAGGIVEADVVTGGIECALPLFADRGKGYATDFRLSYRSLDKVHGPLGTGWTHLWCVTKVLSSDQG